LRRYRAGCLAAALAFLEPARAASQADPEGWIAFEGAWSASGSRHAIAVEGGAEARILEMSGALVLSRGDGLSRGFRGEVIGFDDGIEPSVGRCVWTDERGDQVFSRLTGERLESGRRLVGTITGGTGRYAGLKGEYAFTWQFVLSSEDGLVQSRAVSLSGRVRRGRP
jgi:hypothetical protein